MAGETRGATAVAHERYDVDGVPVLGAVHDGPVRAALLFRVGTVDEAPARRGITHLCEHLAIESVGRPIHSYNGVTGPTFTSFFAEGTAEEVGSYLAAVCRGLHDLPEHRFEAERRVLAAEARGRDDRTLLSTLLAWRYGAGGWGALELGDVGLPEIGFDELRSWASSMFTTGNAVAWVTGPDPNAVLTALPLPPGPRIPAPEPVTVLADLPGWGRMPLAGPGLGLVGTRSVALRAGVAAVAWQAQDRLRGDRGVVYAVASTYEPMTASQAHVHVGADADPEHHDEVVDGILRAFDDVSLRGPNDDVVERLRRAMDDSAVRPGDRAAMWVPGAAARLLDGVEPESYELLRAEEASLDRERVAAALAEASPSALLLVPEGAKDAPAPFTKVPDYSRLFPHRGRRFRDVSGKRTLQVGDGFLTLTLPEGAVVIEGDQCPLVMRWDDGQRLVVGRDGMRVHIAPWDWRDGDRVVAEVDGFAAPDRYVRRGPGSGPPEGAKRASEVSFGVIAAEAAAAVIAVRGVVALVSPTEGADRAVGVVLLLVAAAFAALAWWRATAHRR